METNCLFASFYGQKWVIPEGQFCTSQWLLFYTSERCWKGKCLYPVLALSQQQQHHPAVQAAAQGEDVAHSWSVEPCMLPQNEEERQGRWRKGGKDRNPSIPITFHSSARWSWPSKNILTVHLYSFCLGPSLLGGFFSSWNYVYRNACKRLALKKAPFFFFFNPIQLNSYVFCANTGAVFCSQWAWLMQLQTETESIIGTVCFWSSIHRDVMKRYAEGVFLNRFH